MNKVFAFVMNCARTSIPLVRRTDKKLQNFTHNNRTGLLHGMWPKENKP